MPIPYKDPSEYSVKEKKKNIEGTTNLLHKSFKLMWQQMWLLGFNHLIVGF